MDNTKTGIVALVASLIVFGGTIALTPAEIDDAYYCALTDQVGIFDRLSDSMKTGYYMLDGIEKSSACRDGMVYDTWMPLREYAELNGVPLEEVINPVLECNYDTTVVVKGVQGSYECRFDEVGLVKYSKCYKNGVFSVYAGELLCG